MAYKAFWRLIGVAPVVASLMACASDPYAQDISSLDLSDGTVIARVAQSLDAQDRATFQTFAVRHLASSKNFCGNAERHAAGTAPRTVREALAQTRAWEAQDAQDNPDPTQMTALEREYFALRELEDELADAMDMQAHFLMLSTDPEPQKSEDYRKHEAQIEVLSKQVIRKRATLRKREAAAR